MTTMPDTISRYFAASASKDVNGIVGCFTDDATVIDEGKQYDGAKQIRAWREGQASAYVYTTAIRGVDETTQDEFAVRVRLIGNFPGGQVDLTQVFRLRGDRIDQLRI